ncbi:MAG: T9SS type A sorting domain-containing protein, partial [Candidatus Eisenbacteria bacterium]|nr:T9SS type A sorting domain-containing protein [Candidatus Eisenbacteria bacterium]
SGVRLELNSANHYGGAICASGEGNTTIGYCTMANNSGTDEGGAVYVGNSTDAELDHCTLDSNATDGNGAGVTVQGQVTLTSTIISFSTSGSALWEDGGDAALSCCCIYGNAGGQGDAGDDIGLNDNISEDPCYCNALEGDYHLWNFSPCNRYACDRIGAWGVGCWDEQDVRNEEMPRGGIALDLRGWSPNPILGSSTLRYSIDAGSGSTPVDVVLFDASGRRIRQLLHSDQPSGRYALQWNGTDDRGRRVAGGTYFCRVRAGDEERTNRFIVLR